MCVRVYAIDCMRICICVWMYESESVMRKLKELYLLILFIKELYFMHSNIYDNQ